MTDRGDLPGLQAPIIAAEPMVSHQPELAGNSIGSVAPANLPPANVTPAHVTPAHVPPGWVAGVAYAPFGLVVGFTITALPFLLTRAGISLDHVASVSATVMSPTFWGFLLNPLLDTGFTRRTYCWITAGISAICLALAMWVLSPRHLSLATAFLLLGELSIVLFGGAVGGWTAEFVPESLRGSVGGWTNVANLGAGALGSLAVMSAATRFAPRWIGLGMTLAVLAGATPLLFFPAAKKPSFRLAQVFSDTMRAIWQASRRRECLVGFALFLAPRQCRGSHQPLLWPGQ